MLSNKKTGNAAAAAAAQHQTCMLTIFAKREHNVQSGGIVGRKVTGRGSLEFIGMVQECTRAYEGRGAQEAQIYMLIADCKTYYSGRNQ